MKKTLLIALFAFFGVLAYAQVCVPDPQYTTAGTYPDSSIGLPDACVNELYDVTVTIVVPYDTTGSFPPFANATARYDSVAIKNWTDPGPNGLALPPNFTAACEPPGCVFPGPAQQGQISKGCLLITGMVTNPADIAEYFLFVDVMAYMYLTSPVSYAIPIDDGVDVDYYSINVKAEGTCGSGVRQNSQKQFSIAQNVPNPFSKNTKITFTNNKRELVNFQVFNMLGEMIYSENIYSIDGSNVILFDGNMLPTGIYSYSLNNGEKTISKRMILLEKK